MRDRRLFAASETRGTTPAAIERVQHASDDCTGTWRLRLLYRTVECLECGAIYPCDTDVILAAIGENTAGAHLKDLADEGARLLRAGGDDVRRD